MLFAALSFQRLKNYGGKLRLRRPKFSKPVLITVKLFEQKVSRLQKNLSRSTLAVEVRVGQCLG